MRAKHNALWRRVGKLARSDQLLVVVRVPKERIARYAGTVHDPL
jgi:hypothetical protein